MRSLAGTMALLVALIFGCSRVTEVDDTGPGPADTDTTSASGDTDGDGDSDGDSDTDTDTWDTDPPECAAEDYGIEYNPINMLILLDRSGSMQSNTIEDETYAEVVSSALLALVQDTSEMINYGLAAFPSPACDEESSPFNCTPAQSPENPLVEVGSETSDQIDLALEGVGTCGGTPTCQSLVWARDYLLNDLGSEAVDRPSFVLLATDGAPNCNANADIGSCICTADVCQLPEQCLDDVCTYNAAFQDFAAAGIPVFVIGVGDELAEWDFVLDDIADYGGTGQYYPAADPAEFADALDTITGEALSCTFAVDWDEVDPDGTEFVDKRCNKVNVYGVVDEDDPGQNVLLPHSVDCSTANAWHWQGEVTPFDGDTPLEYCTTIDLCEGACAALSDDTYVSVKASFGCETIPD